MDHGKADGVRPTIHFPVQYVFVEDDDSEAQEDPDGHIEVTEQDLLDEAGVGGRGLEEPICHGC